MTASTASAPLASRFSRRSRTGAHRPPRDRSGLVRRERLVRRLLEAADVPLVLAVAPAGYGKTTALAQWAEHDSREFAWLTVRDVHDDPDRLLTDIGHAVDELEPIGGDLFDVLADPDRGPFVLVLDDVHRIAGREAVQVLKTIAEHMPDGSQLVIASREEPRLPMGRMRANRMICDLGSEHLAMTRGEATALLELCGLEMDADDVATLMARTEGWPVGIYLASLALQGQPHIGRALARFGGDDRVVADYFRDEVLSGLRPEQLLSLARTSVLDILSGSLCDAVLRQTGSGKLLSELARSNVFLVPLDRADESFRYHGLFADVLKAQLRSLEPENEAELHRRASAWYREHGEVDLAIDHAVAAGDAELAGELLWPVAWEYTSQGHNAVIRRWLDQFPNGQIAAHPALALTAATSCLGAGRGNWVEHWASAAATQLDSPAVIENATRLKTGVTIMRAAVGRGGFGQILNDAGRALDREPEESPWRPLCCFLMGAAAHLSGDRSRAAEWLSEGARRAAVATPGAGGLCCAQLALIAVGQDDWNEADVRAARARTQTGQAGLADYPCSALVFAVSALVSAHVGRVDGARQDLTHATRLLSTLEDFAYWYEIQTQIVLARAALRLSDVVDARTRLTKASRGLREMPDAVVLAEWLDEAQQVIGASVVAQSSLTTAELRVLCMLPTHLSYREIAGRLNVSASTVKSQAHAAYRKLGASSRSDAVTCARAAGLLDP